MPEVPATTTPIAEADAAALLVASLQRELGRKPNRNTAALLLAQLWLESNRGQSVRNNNPGNLTANPQSAAKFWRPPWFREPTDAEGNQVGWNNQRNADLHKLMLEGKAPSAFLAFDTMGDGFRVYVEWLHRKFPSILAAADTGDSLATARAIKESGYCPDCEPGATAKTLATFRTQFLAKGYFNALPLVPAGEASAQASSSLESLSRYSGGPFAVRKVPALPTLFMGCAGPAVELCKALADFPAGPFFDDAFRLHLGELCGEVFTVDNIVGRNTWAFLIHRLRGKLNLWAVQ